MNVPINEIEAKLCTFIEVDLLEETHQIHPDTALLEIGMDSLSIIELLLYSERVFQINLPDQIMTKENLQSVRHFAICIKRYMHD